MSQENVEVARRAIDLWNRGEIETALDLAHEDFKMDWSNSIGPLRGVYRGRQSVLDAWTTFRDAWDEVHWEVLESIDVDDTRAIIVTHMRLRGRGSGAEVDASGTQLWTVRDGKGQSVKLYQSKAEALEAVGLAE